MYAYGRDITRGGTHGLTIGEGNKGHSVFTGNPYNSLNFLCAARQNNTGRDIGGIFQMLFDKAFRIKGQFAVAFYIRPVLGNPLPANDIFQGLIHFCGQLVRDHLLLLHGNSRLFPIAFFYFSSRSLIIISIGGA